MCEASRFVVFALCALISAGSAVNSLQRAAAAEITFSVGAVRLDWPADSVSLHAEAEQLEAGFCRAAAHLQLVSYASCRQGLSALLGAASARTPGAERHAGLRAANLRSGAQPSPQCVRMAVTGQNRQPWYLRL